VTCAPGFDINDKLKKRHRRTKTALVLENIIFLIFDEFKQFILERSLDQDLSPAQVL